MNSHYSLIWKPRQVLALVYLCLFTINLQSKAIHANAMIQIWKIVKDTTTIRFSYIY